MSVGDRLGGNGPRGIYLIPVDGGDPRPLIVSKPGRADFRPTFSPDGRRLAYVSCGSADRSWVLDGCAVSVIELNAQTATATPARRVTMEGSVSPFLDSLAWTRDGSAVLFEGGGVTWSSGIWRITITGDHAPERIAAAGEAALTPAVAASRDRLAFSRAEFDADIYRFEAGRPVQLVTGSTFSEADPRLSPDGHRLAFASARSGGQNEDVWVADVDGSNPQQLTKGPGLNQGSPDWSPDGRRIVFDSRGDDRTTLWTIDANGGAPHRLTTAAGDQVRPTWSHDGQWIYFSGGRRDIFRVPAGGGDAKRLTNGAAGPFACESADGKNLLYQTKDADAPLMMMPLTGGQSRQLVACVKSSAFGAGPRGVYYVSCDPSPDPPLHVLDPKTGRDERLGTLDGMRDRPLGLSVSADGRTIVYARAVLSRADLMLIENFR